MSAPVGPNKVPATVRGARYFPKVQCESDIVSSLVLRINTSVVCRPFPGDRRHEREPGDLSPGHVVTR